MNIIAQFIWTISDVLGLIGLLIMVLAFGVAWMWAKIDTRRRRKGSKRRPNGMDERARSSTSANTDSTL